MLLMCVRLLVMQCITAGDPGRDYYHHDKAFMGRCYFFRLLFDLISLKSINKCPVGGWGREVSGYDLVLRVLVAKQLYLSGTA